MRSLVVFLLLLGVVCPTVAAAQSLGDPTRPPDMLIAALGIDDALEGTHLGGLSLSAILISPERRVAVINGHRLRPGDEIAGLIVDEIRPWGVTLNDDGEAVELRLSRRTVTAAEPPSEMP